MELETRVALLERSEEFYKRLADEAHESRRKVWQKLDQLNTDFLNFRGEIRTEISSDIMKLAVKVATISGGLSILVSIVVGIALKNFFK